MKGSYTVVDVYSWLAIFHGQCATALFNAALSATSGFLFKLRHLHFLGNVHHEVQGMSLSHRAAPSTPGTPRTPTPLHPPAAAVPGSGAVIHRIRLQIK